MDSIDLPTRDEVLRSAPAPARRAQTLVFLIESRTAHLVARSRQAMALIGDGVAARERDLAFVEAFSLARRPPLRPSIQDLERYADRWADLIPAQPRLRAAVAHYLSEKYTLRERSVPGIRAALGLDTAPVRQAYQRLYDAPLASIYAPRVGLSARLRWAASALSRRLESLPPFWTTFALTLTETVGGGILALPIAVASIGPLPGILLLLAIGLMTMLTLTAVSEAIARSGVARYEGAYFGRIVAAYLGPVATYIPIAALALLASLSLLAYYVGVSTTLATVLSIPPVVGAALLFLVGLYLISRHSLSATISSALLVGAWSILLILIMAGLALPHLRRANLLYVALPVAPGHPFRPAFLGLVFGVMLTAYFGHLSVANCARVVLRRDPSGRSLIWGGAAAQVAAGLYALFVFAVNGAVPAAMLAGGDGVTVGPLQAVAGPAIGVVGVLFVIPAMGMASVHMSYALRNLVREWLPGRSRSVVLLPRRRARLLFDLDGPPGGFVGSLGLSYLGADDGRPRFRAEVRRDGRTHSVELAVDGSWALAEMTELLPALPRPGAVSTIGFEVLDADADNARLRVSAPRPPAYEGDWTASGAPVAALLELPATDRALVQWLMRRSTATFREIAAYVGGEERAVQATVEALLGAGTLEEAPSAADGAMRYRAHFARRAARHLPPHIWQALGQEAEAPPSAVQGVRRRGASLRAWRGWAGRALGVEHVRSWLSPSPVILIFLVTELLLSRGQVAFAGPLEFAGVIAVSVLAGIYPMLLLRAGRRKGAYVPRPVFRALGSTAAVAVLYLLFLANLVVHGLIIWQEPLERLSALLVAAIVIAVTIAVIRRGAFARRVVLEVRGEPSGRGVSVAATGGGRLLSPEVALEYADGSVRRAAANGPDPLPEPHRVEISLPPLEARELDVWAHRVAPDGASEALPARVDVRIGDRVMHRGTPLVGGHLVVPFSGERCAVGISLHGDADHAHNSGAPDLAEASADR